MNLIDYINNYDEFISRFEVLEPLEYLEISKSIDIPLIFLTNAAANGFEISDFKKLVGNQMYWTIKAIKNNENIYEDISSSMNSYEFYPPICILTNLIGFILGCRACNEEYKIGRAHV